MTVKTEPLHTGEFLVSEGNNSISRELIALAPSLTLEPGTVMSKKTDDGLYYPLAPAAIDGTETAAGVLYAGKVTDANGGDGVIVARLAEVNESLLVWPTGISDEDKAAAVNQLAGLDIILRS